MGSPVHLFLIQETHWSLESEWQTEDLFMIHSGNSNRKAGILIMIDRSFNLYGATPLLERTFNANVKKSGVPSTPLLEVHHGVHN